MVLKYFAAVDCHTLREKCSKPSVVYLQTKFGGREFDKVEDLFLEYQLSETKNVTKFGFQLNASALFFIIIAVIPFGGPSSLIRR